MVELVSQPNHGTAMGKKEGGSDVVVPSDNFQNFIDDLVLKLNESLFGTNVRLTSYTVATLPDVPAIEFPGLIYVSDETGGAVPAFSDGTDWRRVTDRAVVS